MSDDLIKRDDALATIDTFKRDFEQSWKVQFRANIYAIPAVKDDRIEQLERDKVLDDGRPCVTDVFLSAAIEQLDDKWYFFEAVKCWCEGDWEGALEGIELEGKE
jgi:hypothetical protein